MKIVPKTVSNLSYQYFQQAKELISDLSIDHLVAIFPEFKLEVLYNLSLLESPNDMEYLQSQIEALEEVRDYTQIEECWIVTDLEGLDREKSRMYRLVSEVIDFLRTQIDCQEEKSTLSTASNGEEQNVLDTSEEGASYEAEGLKLTLKEIALLHFYQGNAISRENASTILEDYQQNSGAKLCQWYNFYCQASQRHGYSTQKTLNNQIKRIKNVMAILPEDKQCRAMDDLKTLESHLIE